MVQAGREQRPAENRVSGFIKTAAFGSWIVSLQNHGFYNSGFRLKDCGGIGYSRNQLTRYLESLNGDGASASATDAAEFSV
jgi:hypothetical protein